MALFLVGKKEIWVPQFVNKTRSNNKWFGKVVSQSAVHPTLSAQIEFSLSLLHSLRFIYIFVLSKVYVSSFTRSMIRVVSLFQNDQSDILISERSIVHFNSLISEGSSWCEPRLRWMFKVFCIFWILAKAFCWFFSFRPLALFPPPSFFCVFHSHFCVIELHLCVNKLSLPCCERLPYFFQDQNKTHRLLTSWFWVSFYLFGAT